MKKPKIDIAIYGSHNGSVAIAIDNKIEIVIEVERFLNQKNCGMFFYYTANTQEYLLESIRDYIVKHYGITEYTNCIADYTRGKEKTLFPAKKYHEPFHHLEHAYGSYFQGKDKNALIFSFDGGGRDGFFNVYYADPVEVKLLKQINLDIGFAYMSFGDFLGDIKHEPLWLGNLIYPGKIMGLCAYGQVKDTWIEPFKDYYRKGPEGPTYKEYIKDLGNEIGINFFIERLTGQVAYDIAATSQRAFEEVFLENVEPFLKKYPNLPIHMTGGCALNIILNTRLKNMGREVFVSPNPNDCGLAVGMLCRLTRTKQDITYSGLPVLDQDMLMSYCEEYNAKDYTTEKLVEDLNYGRIVGVVRGNAEHGPRALGNRSILCNPGTRNMKDILNEKVKNREWYRPFAPVVRLEDVSKYFDWHWESRWMSFCVPVKKEWQIRLASITHVDGTARIQTVTKEQNPWLYNLLGEFEKKSGYGVLLNTSFNVAGKPILSSYRDAIKVFSETQMDRLLLENKYFSK